MCEHYSLLLHCTCAYNIEHNRLCKVLNYIQMFIIPVLLKTGQHLCECGTILRQILPTLRHNIIPAWTS